MSLLQISCLRRARTSAKCIARNHAWQWCGPSGLFSRMKDLAMGWQFTPAHYDGTVLPPHMQDCSIIVLFLNCSWMKVWQFETLWCNAWKKSQSLKINAEVSYYCTFFSLSNCITERGIYRQLHTRMSHACVISLVFYCNNCQHFEVHLVSMLWYFSLFDIWGRH